MKNVHVGYMVPHPQCTLFAHWECHMRRKGFITREEMKKAARTENVVRTTEGPARANVSLISRSGTKSPGTVSACSVGSSRKFRNMLTRTNTSSIPAHGPMT
jgi:hypothetical protein